LRFAILPTGASTTTQQDYDPLQKQICFMAIGEKSRPNQHSAKDFTLFLSQQTEQRYF
jgi:hypothetical protein